MSTSSFTRDRVLKRNSDGLIGSAFELVEFEPIYRDLFAYIFGDTLVFKDLNSARIQLFPAKFLTAGHDEVNVRTCPESMF